jgi:pimeloyl-ACP methyl ester carboxylesterase
MTAKISRRGLLHISYGTAAALGISAVAGEFDSTTELARSEPAGNSPGEGKTAPTASADSRAQLFYRDDWFGEPWLKPEPALLIHGVGESSIAWFGWVPRMAREFRVLRPDLPGLGQSAIPPNFEWSMPNLATVLSHFLDTLQVESAHVIGAKLGGAIAMQFAADYPRRTRTLTVASAPISTPKFSSTAAEFQGKTWVQDTQRNRLGSAAPKEEIEYWNNMMGDMSSQTKDGIKKVTSTLNMESVLPRITAPTLVITTDRSALQPVETVLQYQKKIPNSRLLVLPSDAYHVAVAKANECVTSVLGFIKETKQRA